MGGAVQRGTPMRGMTQVGWVGAALIFSTGLYLLVECSDAGGAPTARPLPGGGGSATVQLLPAARAGEAVLGNHRRVLAPPAVQRAPSAPPWRPAFIRRWARMRRGPGGAPVNEARSGGRVMALAS